MGISTNATLHRQAVDGQLLLWFGLLVGAGVGTSYTFGCTTPFAAVATLAALTLPCRHGLAVVAVVWLANQAIGYGLLGYPGTLDSVLWGAAIGVSSILAFVAASAFATRHSGPVPYVWALCAAFAGYQLGLYCAGLVLGAGSGTVALAVVGHAAVVNLVAFTAILIAARGVDYLVQIAR